MADLVTEGFAIYFHKPFWASLDDNKREQLATYMEAYEIFLDREKQYKSLWQRTGAHDSLQHVVSKAARCQFYLEGSSGEDTPLDLINFAVFLIRNMRAGRIHPEREGKQPVIATAMEDIRAGDMVVLDIETGKIAKSQGVLRG